MSLRAGSQLARAGACNHPWQVSQLPAASSSLSVLSDSTACNKLPLCAWVCLSLQPALGASG